MFSGAKAFNVLQNITAQTLDYSRRKKEFIEYAYQVNYDTVRGRVLAYLDRREGQRRGHEHNHINEYHEPCSLPAVRHGVAMTIGDPHCTSSDTDCFRGSKKGVFCRSYSQHCLKAGHQCQLPVEANGTPYHMKTHSGSTTAEMLRPFPLGSTSSGPDVLATPHCGSLEEVYTAVAESSWTSDRLSSSSPTTAFKVQCEGTLIERLQRVLDVPASNGKPTFEKPMTLQDLLAAYYYRRVQAAVALHVCRLGYCRQKWDQPCKFGLPCTEVSFSSFSSSLHVQVFLFVASSKFSCKTLASLLWFYERRFGIFAPLISVVFSAVSLHLYL